MKYLKKVCIAITAICICLSGSGITSQAAVAPQKADYAAAGLKYYIRSDKKTVAVKIQNEKANIKIPEKVKIKGKSYRVTEIKSTAIKHDTVVMDKKEAVARDNKQYFKNTKTKTVSIPKTVTKIETGAFSYFTKLKKITVSKENQKYMSTSKGVFSKDGKTLILAFNGTGTYKVKSGVEKIAARAFVGTKYSKVSLPDSCYEIGIRAFFKCSKLTQVKGGSLCVCGKYAFFGTKVKGVDKYGTMLFEI